MKKKPEDSVDKDVLAELKEKGCDSTVLLARIDYVEREGLRRNLTDIAKKPRAHSDILPTQASGRWSTKKPNLGGFDRRFWKEHFQILYPDPGTYWLEWDWSGIEARMFCAYSRDQEDLDWLQPGCDIHTLTARKYLFESDTVPTEPVDGRTLCKNFRYGVLQYGRNKYAVQTIPGLAELGIDRATALRRAEQFLNSRPGASAFKHRVWEEAIAQRHTRTGIYGRRRWLFGDADSRAKEGLNHIIQGSVADMMNWSLIQLARKHILGLDWGLVLNKHDGAIVWLHDSLPVEEALVVHKKIVEREWDFAGGKMSFPAEWKLWQGRERSTV